MNNDEKLPKTIKWFWAESAGVHNFGGAIHDERDEMRVRRVYKPGQKSILSLTIGTYRLVYVEEQSADVAQGRGIREEPSS